MSAPMPDFEMPDEASGDAGRRRRLPRVRRIVGIGATVALLAGLAIVGVPALVEQQRGRDALAVAERYAADVAAGAVDAVVTAQAPDAAVASDALLRDGALTPVAPFVVDDVELLAVHGQRATVRVLHTIGPDDGTATIELLETGCEWRIVEGLLGVVAVPYELALSLGDARADGPAWLLPGRYGFDAAPLGVVEVHSDPFVVVPGERVDAVVVTGPTMEALSIAYVAVEAFVDEHRGACDDACLLGDETGVSHGLAWDLDLESRTGTVTATITTMAPSAVDPAMGPLTSSLVVFDVVLADDLQSLTVTPAGTGVP